MHAVASTSNATAIDVPLDAAFHARGAVRIRLRLLRDKIVAAHRAWQSAAVARIMRAGLAAVD